MSAPREEGKWTAKRFYTWVVLGGGTLVGAVIGVFYLFSKFPVLPILLGAVIFVCVLEGVRRDLNY